ncbi:beta-galactosidase [Microbacterium sp. zg.Y1090]|uniref:glycoside hydrolase family 35 protein n=1 Tax=Microbacterium TaxID=33882 RepID=UPI00214AB601|nr:MULTISPECIES: beta-galactosidase family protein [unclassified Microbacterium]MCR2812366.1 beta-galactosidase [Microbacterium sp. zg.Y1084]MCR2817833.1 beta-galactosidase [Microbacterium sp. zg.Y1090]MDL5485523.1 beta-galactosidase [Microbacterium sp. zg-Y1211]WIM28695.1 beta-galactosidase [Microbacterium sp. zg-Y1090]
MDPSSAATVRPSVAALTYADSTLLRHGRPHRMLAGAVHYFRVHPDQWEDRLRRLAAMGANTVDTYIPWNFHEQTEGDARFDGWRDIERYLRIAAEVGLDVYVRPSPYICAEWSNGGLPAWLTGRIRHVRSSDPAYLRAVEEWYAQLLPRLAPLQTVHGGPIVAVQVENEYGSFGSDRAYLEHQRELLRAHGIVELLTTADGITPDMQRHGSVEGAMPSFTFGTGVETACELLPEATPLLCSEMWGGWFDHWGERHHVRSAQSMIGTVDALLAAGGSVSLYMAHGGTNFGLWAGANFDGVLQPTVTSYDSDAPIAEDGRLGDKFAALREAFAPFHDGPLPSLPPEPVFLPPHAVPFTPEGTLDAALQALPAGSVRSNPASFEELGVADGIVAYETQVDIGSDATLSIMGLHDRAAVLLDGRRIATLERDGATTVALDGVTGKHRLTLVVESLGRINYGPRIGEHKGILGGVLLGRRYVHGWTHRVVPLDGSLRGAGGEATADGFAVATVEVTEQADAWLAVPGGSKGLIWLNGFLLGRYWSVGPQETLYAPAPLWREGSNEVRVLDLEQLPRTLDIRDRPSLGEREEFIGS